MERDERPPRPPAPDPAEVARVSDYLARLTDQQYAEALADCIVDPDPAEQAAFRSEDMAQRSLVAARYLLDHVNARIRRNTDETNAAWQLRAEHFRNRVGMERRLLEAIVAGIRASKGILSAAPNPRGRAMRELARLHPVEFLALVRAEQEKDAEKARLAKEERKAAKRAARGAAQPEHGRG